MADINSTYYPGGQQVTTQAPGAGVGGMSGFGMPDLASILAYKQAMAARRAAMEERQMLLQEAAAKQRLAMGDQQLQAFRQQQAREGTMAGREASVYNARPAANERGPSMADQQFQAMQRAAQMKQLEAAGNPPPTRLVQGIGIIPGETLDTNRMNAYQRQLFLPQGSSTNYMGPGARVSPGAGGYYSAPGQEGPSAAQQQLGYLGYLNQQQSEQQRREEENRRNAASGYGGK